MKNSARIVAIFAAALSLMSPAVTRAHETDQFSNRAVPIADSTEILNRKVNEAIAEAALEQRGNDDRMAFVNALYKRLGGRLLVDRIEKWAIESPKVDKLPTDRYDSIYSEHPIWAVRVTKLFGIGETIRVNEQLIGTDKLGHFMSQGRKYYRRFLRYESEEKAAEQAAFAEQAVFGQISNGNFSLGRQGLEHTAPVRLGRPRQRVLGRGAQHQSLRCAAVQVYVPGVRFLLPALLAQSRSLYDRRRAKTQGSIRTPRNEG